MTLKIQRFVGIRPLRVWRLVAQVTFIAVVTVTSIQEYHRPWYFYDWVGSRIPIPNDIFGEYGLRVDVRQRTAVLARSAAGIEGVSRVEWPIVFVYESVATLLDRPSAVIRVHVEDDASPKQIGQELEDIYLSGPSEIEIAFVIVDENEPLVCSTDTGTYACVDPNASIPR